MFSRIRERQENLVQFWISQISADFELILILEELDLSLAVFAIQNCWQVRDVVHFKLNTMTQQSPTLTPSGQANLRKFNWADFMLYDHFARVSDAFSTFYSGFIFYAYEII